MRRLEQLGQRLDARGDSGDEQAAVGERAQPARGAGLQELDVAGREELQPVGGDDLEAPLQQEDRGVAGERVRREGGARRGAHVQDGVRPVRPGAAGDDVDADAAGECGVERHAGSLAPRPSRDHREVPRG